VIRKKLKANDCLVLAHAIHHHADLYTFDAKLRKAFRSLQANFS
jgi:predicted nucleic acid-binding protein